MTTPKTAELINHFSVKAIGGDIAKLADINGDGHLEMLILQTAGVFQSQLFKDRHDAVDDVDRALYCLTAIDLNGNVLWQDGTPYDREMPFTGHGGKRMLLADDVDADGQMEVVVIRKHRLAVLDAATSRCKCSIELPSDNIVSVFSTQIGPRENGRHLICKVNGLSYPPWDYANPTMVFNHDLSVFHEPFAVRGAGHNLVAMDINDDGFDEFFIGYSLFDRELNEVWKLDLGPDFDYISDHADNISVSDFNNDGKLEVRYAGSKDFFVTDLDGNILWRTTAGHSQTSIEGGWGPNGEKRIIMNEKNRGVWCLDESGKIIWNRTDINGYARHNVRWHRNGVHTDWPLFRPQQKPISPTPYDSDPDASHGLWPKFLGEDGTLHEVFPWRDEYTQPKRLIQAQRSYDCGVIYNVLAEDIDGDGLDEVIVFDRYSAWVFHSPE